MIIQILSVTWVRKDKRASLRAEEKEPIYLHSKEELEEYRKTVTGDADKVLLAYTTYES